ncbi:LysR family transcriptional regulator [Rhizobium sp. P38BS-XIX]|uniref:LysR family transcriptional regulator n=1 Tax=Rhizobium sp. P38BS-XIX TaxID=2726740 RepID=UPI001456A029|nr:LysR family transcriptional regulator [Rhizobium sp. P38BS-XIX]NLR97433.1 LysR family transcriptional regulator [Rhizobium sp. P38BS-XIX]
MKLDDMAAFARVAQLGNFTRAALALGMSTSNLSHTIRRLETAVGHRLLQRNSRSVSVTEAGKTLLEAVEPSLVSIYDALESLDQKRDLVSGTLRLTATRQAYEAVVRPVLVGFSKAYPQATIEVLIDTAYRDIVADQLDAGIRLGEKLQQDMIALKVGPDLAMAVVASPDYLENKPAITQPADLTGHRCINYKMVTAGSLYAWEFEKDGKPLEVSVSGPLTSNEPEIMLSAALDGVGVGYLLEHEVAPYLENGKLVRLLADWTPPFPGFHLYYPSKRQMRPTLSAFLAMVRQHRSVA